MRFCTCTHPRNEHVHGRCLALLDCGCRGYTDADAYPDVQDVGALSETEVDALVAWIRRTPHEEET
jgi:hypothetical protein